MTTHLGFHHTKVRSQVDEAVLTSSWLSMGSLHKEKRLHALGILFDEDDADLSVKIEYRTESADWTQALAAGTGQRITVTELDVAFYELQIRYTITNGGSGLKDVGIVGISAQYSQNK